MVRCWFAGFGSLHGTGFRRPLRRFRLSAGIEDMRRLPLRRLLTKNSSGVMN